MPSRWTTLGIVLFWLVVNGWLFCHDLLPRLLPGQPPPYAIELIEEARTSRAAVNWLVFDSAEPDARHVARAQTIVEHPQRDVFELAAQIKPERGATIPYGQLRISQIDSAYRVNTVGDLLGLSAHIQARLAFGPEIAFSLQGEVEADQLTPRLQVDAAGKMLTYDVGTIEAPRGGAVLLPLHPVNRLRGLTPGQTWRVHILDTVGVSLGAWRGQVGEMSVARASVRPKEEIFDHGRRHDVACLVIDYEGDDMKVCTWVARRNGLVMCQETRMGQTYWALYRE